MDKLTNAIKQAFDTNELPEGVKQQKLSALLSPSEQTGRDGITMKSRKINKRFAASIAAAAAAAVLTVTAGAVVYNYTNAAKHSENIEHFVEGGDSLPGYDAVAVSNEQLELTIDTLWSDGNYATAIVTAKCFDDEGEALAKNLACFVGYADEEFDPNNWLTGYDRHWKGENSNDINAYDGVQYRFGFNCRAIDKSRKINLYFYNSNEKADRIKPALTAEVSFEPNLETAELYNEAGDKLTLSPLGLYENIAGKTVLVPGGTELERYEFIRADGTEEDNDTLIDGMSSTKSKYDVNENYRIVEFSHIIDVNDYKAVIIDGVEYTRR